MTTNNSFNIYSPVDTIDQNLPDVEKIFISHRTSDKKLATAVANLLENLSVHYWFDIYDEDTQRAAALGLVGDQALVHAIERGIQHSTQVLGLLSANTRGSWWVPYEIGFSRSLNRPISFLVLSDIRSMNDLPEYVRLAANYWSVDELVRWIMRLSNKSMHTPLHISIEKINALTDFVPLETPSITIRDLLMNALSSIDKLEDHKIWEALQLTSTEQFDWLPTKGGLIRDLAYDLLAPIAFFRLCEQNESVKLILRILQIDILQLLCQSYLSITQHYEFAKLDPPLSYKPEEVGWRRQRYLTPASSWLQGLSIEQLNERLDRFFLVQGLDDNKRLATREEFKAEFDQILRSRSENERRSLGVLINPLLGYNPIERPVYYRILNRQQQLYRSFIKGI